MENKKKILYAEDHDATRNCFMRDFPEIFQEFEIEPHKDGISLDKRLGGDVFDVAVVVTDHNMPGITGGALIKKYATKDKFKKIPFILAYGGNESIGRDALFNGAFTYMLKPFGIFSVESCVREAIKSCENS